MSKQLFIPKRPTMNLTNDDLYAILGCIDFVDDNDINMNEETSEYLQTLRNKISGVMEAQAQYDMECG